MKHINLIVVAMVIVLSSGCTFLPTYDRGVDLNSVRNLGNTMTNNAVSDTTSYINYKWDREIRRVLD